MTAPSLLNFPWQTWLQSAKTLAPQGNLPTYIPYLQQANPENLALAVGLSSGEILSFGDTQVSFPLMSLIKPFLLLHCLGLFGEVWLRERVGSQASDLPFNSLDQLQRDRGFPRNAMINSGAIRLAAELSGSTPWERCLTLQHWLNQFLEIPVYLDEEVWVSVRSRPNEKNQALAQHLAEAGHLTDWPLALATYNAICCLSTNITGLAHLGRLLIPGESPCPSTHCQFVQDTLLTCGLYEESLTFAREVGFPTKSGVSGILLSLVPPPKATIPGMPQAIALYSPPLDTQGNSVAGLYCLKKIARHLQTQTKLFIL